MFCLPYSCTVGSLELLYLTGGYPRSALPSQLVGIVFLFHLYFVRSAFSNCHTLQLVVSNCYPSLSGLVCSSTFTPVRLRLPRCSYLTGILPRSVYTTVLVWLCSTTCTFYNLVSFTFTTVYLAFTIHFT